MFDDLIEEHATLTATELDAAIAEAELTKRDAETRLAAAAAVISARGSYHDGGPRSMRSYPKGSLNRSGTVANRIRRPGETGSATTPSTTRCHAPPSSGASTPSTRSSSPR